MIEGGASESEGLPIASVEQATGIARATLRIWERRYGFPHPGRDERGERSYSGDQVQKLRVIAELMGRGHRPGRIVQLTLAQLATLKAAVGEQASAGAGAARERFDDPVFPPLRAQDLPGAVRQLGAELEAAGLEAFVTGRLARLNVLVGQAWARGELQVHEEHLYAEAVQQVLRPQLAHMPRPPEDARPRVLLATFPGESHGLGLLMAHALLALAGAQVSSLGVRVPVAQLLSAAAAYRADIVGLSFTASINPAHAVRGLEQLRAELPSRVAIWAGGTAPVLQRHRIDGVQPMPGIGDVLPAVARWRAMRGTAEPVRP